MSVDPEKIAGKLAASVARGLLNTAQRGGTEADFRRDAARILEEAGSNAGLTITPRDEYAVARGRVDSVYNRLVLEYKRPGVLKPTNERGANRDVIQQVKDYVLDVAKRERREAQRLAGVATDGFHYIFVRRVGEGWAVDDPIPVNKPSTERFLRLLFSLSIGAALVPENLVQDFGPKHSRTQSAVRAIYRGLASSKHPLVGKLFEQWRIFFAEATDYKEWSERIESKPEFRAFVKSLWTAEEIRNLEAARVFFVLHTYYALLIKLVASMAVARFAGGTSTPLSRIAVLEGEDLRQSFKDLEGGGIFKQYGIRNFLEGDFFGWYLAAWNDHIEEGVSSLAKRLADYDPGALELAPENARDLLKKLYHYLLPREIRHDLGEYYTPDWLAERLIRQTLGLGGKRDVVVNPKTRVLDPACGSGTFLVILIRFMKRAVEKGRVKPREALEQILQNVIGFDLNPLAVIAARTNYLIALGDLLKERGGDIDIPVYQADSVLSPQRGASPEGKGQYSISYEGDVYRLRTAVGEFLVPIAFAERDRMDCLTNVLDESVESGVAESAFLSRLVGPAKLTPKETERATPHLRVLYEQLRDLHDDGLNGVWARIVKNQFAPVFLALDPCQYVVGNPPWVNWENLPDEYRNDLIPLYEEVYGLFPHTGLAARHGSAKIDISSLMTYVSADRYLKQGGKLGFVLTQALFKTSGAGQGFRRFVLPDRTPFGPLVVEDMVELKPFEGAANRTVVAVFVKGRAVRYPVSYQYWRKRQEGKGSEIGFDTPYEEVTKEKITYRNWHAEPVDASNPISAWITARPGALRAVRKVLGNSAYSAHAGCFTGGSNAVYWVEAVGRRPGGLALISNVTEGAKRKVSDTQAAIEQELLFPLLRGREVGPWTARGTISILCPQDPGDPKHGIPEKRLAADFPKTFAYFRRFEANLSSRPAYLKYLKRSGEPFYALYDIKKYTFAPWKVVWREQASRLTAAAVGPLEGRPVIPDHKLMMVDVGSRKEACFLSALLNSSFARLAVAAYAIDVQMDTHILRNVAIPRFSPHDKAHIRLAELSEAAHKAATKGDEAEVKRIEDEVDRRAAKVWGLTDQELAEIKRSLEEMSAWPIPLNH